MAVDSGSELTDTASHKALRRRPYNEPDKTHEAVAGRSTPKRRTRAPSVSAAIPLAPVVAKVPIVVDPLEVAPQPAVSAVDRYLDYRNRLVLLAGERVIAMRHLIGYRRSNEELQNAFLALERHLPVNSTAPDLIFADEQRSSDGRVTLGWGSPGLLQLLPVSSVGVSAISLGFLGTAARPGALLRVHLSSIEDQRVIDRWTIPLERLGAGWTMLALTRTLVGSPRTLELRLDLDGQADSSVSLHLGTMQPIDVFRARNATTDLPLFGSGIAMQVWCGEPYGAGAAQPNTIAADVPRDNGINRRFEPLAPALLAKVRRAHGDDAKFSFNPVSYIAYRAGITCHPPVTGRTTACLPMPVSCVVRGFSADVEIGNEKSKPIDFAVAIAANDERARLLLEGAATPADTEAVSAWTSVTPGSPATLTVFRRGDTGPAGAFVAARMSEAGYNDFAWARARNIAITADQE